MSSVEAGCRHGSDGRENTLPQRQAEMGVRVVFLRKTPILRPPAGKKTTLTPHFPAGVASPVAETPR
jgi:hypothetical protein